MVWADPGQMVRTEPEGMAQATMATVTMGPAAAQMVMVMPAAPMVVTAVMRGTAPPERNCPHSIIPQCELLAGRFDGPPPFCATRLHPLRAGSPSAPRQPVPQHSTPSIDTGRILAGGFHVIAGATEHVRGWQVLTGSPLAISPAASGSPGEVKCARAPAGSRPDDDVENSHAPDRPCRRLHSDR